MSSSGRITADMMMIENKMHKAGNRKAFFIIPNENNGF